MTKKKFCFICVFFVFITPLIYAGGINSCQTLTEPNSLYTLNQDIFQALDKSCIIIAAKNITLDCQGYSITSSSLAGIAGIYSTHPYTAIKNCNVDMGIFSSGIELLSANNSYIFNNTLNHQHKGIFLTNVHYTLIEDNIANFNGFFGISIDTDGGTSRHNTLIGNTANNNYYGIWLNNDFGTSSRDTLIGNTANNNSYIGVMIGGGSNNSLDRNTVDNNSYVGIYIASSSDNSIRRNNANHNSRYGIYIDSSSINNNLAENKLCFNSDRDVYCEDNQTFVYNWCDLSGGICGGACLLCSEYRDVCVDGTASGDCSSVNPPLYCDSGYLVFNPNKCGADAGKCCQSVKNPTGGGFFDPRGYATFLAVNVPDSEDCSNAWTYFDNATIGYWVNTTFTEQPGIAIVSGGYPTRVICQEIPFDVMPPKPREGRLDNPYHGVRYKPNACIFVPWGNETTKDKQEQVAVLDWNYSKNSYCVYDGNEIIVKEITYPNITLYPRWNLISLPLIPLNPSISTIMQGCDYNKIWTFESDQSWNSTDTGLTSMDIKHGYWVDRNGLEGNCEIAVEGTIPNRTEMSVYSPWTLVGYPSVTSGLIIDIMPMVSYDKIWAFELDQSWKSTDTGLMTMKYGKGYWIDSAVEGAYNVTN